MNGSTATAPTCTSGRSVVDAPHVAIKSPQENTEVHRPPSLRRNISWTLLGNVVYAACQWGTLVVIARFGTPELLGQFALALAITTPVFMLASLNLRYVQVTDSANRFVPRDFVSLRVLTTLAACIIVTAIGLLSPDAGVLGILLITVAAVKATESFSDVIHGMQHKRECMRAICISHATRGALSLLSVTTLLLATESLTIAVIGMAAVNIFVLMFIDIPMAKSLPAQPNTPHPLAVHWNLQRLIPLAWLSLPVGLATMILSLSTNIPRYFIAHYIDNSALGIYAAAAYLLMATDLVVQASRVTALPRLARLYGEGRVPEFWRLTRRLMLLGAACTVPALLAVWIAGKSILTTIYGPQYEQASDAFFWLMLANVLWQSSVPTAVLLAMQRYWTDFSIRLVSTGVIAIAAWWLVPQHGLVGAAWAIVAGRVTASIGTAGYAMRGLPHSQTLRGCEVTQVSPHPTL
jgi:O-antigen/teichoic acid export membrane protein